MAGLACKGKHLSFIERDFVRRMDCLLNINMEPYELAVNINGTIARVNIILPHELFGLLWWEHASIAEQRMIGPDLVREFWQIEADCDEPFFTHHPMRDEILADMSAYMPIRVWGDDTPGGKHGRGIRTLSWASAATREEAMKSKHMVWCTDLKVTTLEVETKLFGVLAWSLDVLATGRYPFFGPSRQTWEDANDKRRAALSGEYLSPHRHKGVYVQSTGDWTYLN